MEAYNQWHMHCMKQGNYAIGELVLVFNKALEKQFSSKGLLRWRGPYAVVARHPSGPYIVQELDGSILKLPIAWKWMKSYVPQKGLEPKIVAPRWLSKVDEIKEDLLKDDTDKLKVMMAHWSSKWAFISHLPKPWLLQEEAKQEYWNQVWDRWQQHKWLGMQSEEESLPDDVLWAIKEDQELWNFKEDIKADSNRDMPWWKYDYPRIQELYKWAPVRERLCSD